MGGAVSTNVQKDITEVVTKVLISQSQTCSALAQTDISIENTSAGSINNLNNSIDGKTTVNLKCVAEINNTSTLNTELTKKIAQLAKAKLEGLNILQASVSTNAMETSEKIVTEIDIKNVQQQLAAAHVRLSIKNTAGIDINGGSNTIKSTTDILNDTVSRAVSNSETVAKLVKETSQTSTAEAVGLGMSAGLTALIACCALSILGGAFSGGKGGKGKFGRGGFKNMRERLGKWHGDMRDRMQDSRGGDDGGDDDGDDGDDREDRGRKGEKESFLPDFLANPSTRTRWIIILMLLLVVLLFIWWMWK